MGRARAFRAGILAIAATLVFTAAPSLARAAQPEAIAGDWIRRHATDLGAGPGDRVGLRVVRRYESRRSVTHLTFAQTVDDVPVAGPGVQAHVTRDGQIIALSGRLVPEAQLEAPDAALDAGTAAARARRAVETPATQRRATGSGRTRAAGGPDPRRVVVPDARGGRPAYEVFVRGERDVSAMVTVDARNGRVLERLNTRFDALGAAFPRHPGAPVGGTRRYVDLDPWLDPGQKTLVGPNAITFANVDDDDYADARELTRPDRDGDYVFDWTFFETISGVACPPTPWFCSWDHNIPYSWQDNADAAAVNQFVSVNRFHDHLAAAPFEFRSDKGAFEGDDYLWSEVDQGAELDDGLPPVPSHVNNAYFSWAPDGVSPRLVTQLQRPVSREPERPPVNAADDASIVFHEYAHGLSTRLVQDAGGTEALNEQHSRALGEGWSDWYAMDYLVGAGLVTDTSAPNEVRFGEYGGFDRTQALDCPVGAAAADCPAYAEGSAGPGGYTLGELGRVGEAPEIHDSGEVWAQTLWDLRRRMIADHGGAEGLWRTRLLVTAGLELTPPEPTFLDARNAILAAEQAHFGGADRKALWEVFAQRGFGWFAAVTDFDDVEPVESFALPPGGAPGTVRGRLRGDTGAPLAGVRVTLAGAGGLAPGSQLVAVTDATGTFEIGGVPPGTYPRLVATASGGFDGAVASTVAVPPGGTVTQDLVATRNWAMASAGANATADDVVNGCGPGLAIDGRRSTGWLARSPASAGSPTPKHLTVSLPREVDLSSVAIDPSAPCGTGSFAALGGYRIETSTDGVAWRTSAQGAFTKAARGRRNAVAVSAADATRFVRVVALSPVDPSPEGSGIRHIGISELQVYGTATSRPSAAGPTPTPTPTPAGPAVGPGPAGPAGPAGPGPAGSGDPLTRDTVAPLLSRLGFRPARFRVGARGGARLRFTLSEPATVSISVRREVRGRRRGRRCVPASTARRGRPCPLLRLAGRIPPKRMGPAASIRFDGRIRMGGRLRALPSGSYVATVVAVDAAGNRSRARRVRFGVIGKGGRRAR